MDFDKYSYTALIEMLRKSIDEERYEDSCIYRDELIRRDLILKWDYKTQLYECNP